MFSGTCKFFYIALVVFLFFISLQARPAPAGNVQMEAVSELMELPVESILRNTPVAPIAEVEALKSISRSHRPVVLLIYRNGDPRSREIATLIRFLSLEFHNSVDFYAFEEKEISARSILGLERVPATVFYSNDGTYGSGTRESPTLTEYRSPGRAFWKMTYSAAARYLRKDILD